MTAKEQYRQAYSLARSYHVAARGKSAGQMRAIARAFNAQRDQAGIDWRIDHAAREHYLHRRPVDPLPLKARYAMVKAVGHA